MPDDNMGNIFVGYEGKVCSIVLNRPEKLNALTREMIFALRDALTMAQKDPGTHVVVLRGDGAAFCAGDDLSELAVAAARPDQQAALVASLQDVTRQIMLGPKPVIAVVQGWAVGAAFSWIFNCDLSICAESSKAFFPEVKWGVSQTGGATALAPRLLGARAAREALLLSRRFTARELLELGAVTRVVKDGNELQAAMMMARQITELPALALSGVKRLMNRALGGDLEAVLLDEAVLAVSTATGREVGALLVSTPTSKSTRWRKTRV